MEQTDVAQATAPGKRPSGRHMLPPGVGSFNIAQAPPKLLHGAEDKLAAREMQPFIAYCVPPAAQECCVEDVPRAVGDRDAGDRFDALSAEIEARIASKRTPEEEHNAAGVVISALSFIFNVSMLAAVTGPLLMMSALSNLNEKQVDSIGFWAQLADSQARQASAKLVGTNQKGIAGELLPLGLIVKNGSGGERVRISGLPEGIQLSLGTSLGAGKWIVSSNELDLAYVGSSDPSLTFLEAVAELYSSGGRLMDIRNIQFEWVETSEGEAAPPGSTLAEHFRTSTSERLKREPEVIGSDLGSHGEEPEIAHLPRLSGTPEVPTQQQSLDSDRAIEMLRLGEDLLNRGDIAAARLALEHAVMGKNAQAALELAMTFDWYFLNKWRAVGTIGDDAKARTWYQQAMRLGATEASIHLNRLSRKPHPLSTDRGRP